jgi:hypothetical protein
METGYEQVGSSRRDLVAPMTWLLTLITLAILYWYACPKVGDEVE